MKILVLTDSGGNPRSFPLSDATQLEETYPYLLRSRFKESTFWQLSFGNVVTEQLCSQATGYLNHWEPDIIIVHSGLNDCRPEAFSEFQKSVIIKLSWRYFSRFKKYLYYPSLIKRRSVYRVSKRNFRKTLTKFKLIFSHSTIYWLEICAGLGYEEIRPGVNKRMEDYNKIIKEIYTDYFVTINHELHNVNGFNDDNLHLNKKGHRAIADLLIDKINSSINKK